VANKTGNTASTLRTQYKVADFVNWQRGGSLVLNPKFQRRPVWKKGAKSYLIDTILRGLPIPIIFLRDLPADLRTLAPKRDVVDGQQRLRTIFAFINSELLSDFDQARDEFVIDATHNEELGGQNFAQLSAANKQQILDYQFSVHIFPADTDDREILQIFARMNSTGLKLNAQELRNAEYYGKFKTLAYQLATEHLAQWREWHIFSDNAIARMNEVELSSEFMMLIAHGTLDKNKKAIDDFYEKYDDSFPDGPEVARRFRGTFEAIESVLDTESIATLFNTRTLFFALFAAIYGLQYGLRWPSKSSDRLNRQRSRPIAPDIVKQLRSSARRIKDQQIPLRILKAVRGATSDASERKALIGFLVGKDSDPCRELALN
jgi:hypothetical protein